MYLKFTIAVPVFVIISGPISLRQTKLQRVPLRKSSKQTNQKDWRRGSTVISSLLMK